MVRAVATDKIGGGLPSLRVPLALVACCVVGCFRLSVRTQANTPPVAVVTQSLTANVGETVILDGGASSDADGDALSYRWELISGANDAVLLANADQAIASFAAPLRGQRLFAKLVVSDGAASSVPATVQIRVNAAPTADAGPDRALKRPAILEASGSDADGDLLIGFQWRVIAPACPGCLSAPDARFTAFDPPVPGQYTLGLVVSDGALSSVEDVVTITLNEANRAPVLVLNRTSQVAESGASFGALSAAESFDPDGDPVVVTWERVDGSASYPSTYSGPTLAISAPSFASLLDAPTGSAKYSVTASDGQLTSAAQLVAVHTAPGADFVLVSGGNGSADAPGCGTLALPCRSVAFALTQSAGRSLVLTSGVVSDAVTTEQTIGWPAGVNAYGGRDPVTFEQSTPTTWRVSFDNGSAPSPCQGVTIDGAASVTLRQVNLVYAMTVPTVALVHEALNVRNSQVLLDHVSVSSAVDLGWNVAVGVHGPGAEVTLRHSKVTAGGGDRTNRGVDVTQGGTAHLLNSEVRVIATTTLNQIGSLKQCAACVDASTLNIDGSKLSLVGSHTFTETGTAPVSCNGSTLDMTRSVVINSEDPYISVVSAGTSTVSISHSTLIGMGPLSTGGPGLSTDTASKVWNTLFKSLGHPLRATTSAANSAQLYGNVFDDVAGLAECSGGGVIGSTGLGEFNTTGCGAGSFGQNLIGSCPLLADQLHLTSGIANACVDSAQVATPAGVAGALDIDGQTRGALPDVGPDEL